VRDTFLKSAAILLALTALAKGINTFGGAEALSLRDPVLGLENRQMLLIATLVEAGAVALLLGRVLPVVK
jgi:hypothetical protein